MKKHLLIALSVLISLGSLFTNSVYANIDSSLELTQFQEETEIQLDSTYGKARWYYRMVNGREQKKTMVFD